jgi:hypothetical protein
MGNTNCTEVMPEYLLNTNVFYSNRWMLGIIVAIFLSLYLRHSMPRVNIFFRDFIIPIIAIFVIVSIIDLFVRSSYSETDFRNAINKCNNWQRKSMANNNVLKSPVDNKPFIFPNEVMSDNKYETFYNTGKKILRCTELDENEDYNENRNNNYQRRRQRNNYRYTNEDEDEDEDNNNYRNGNYHRERNNNRYSNEYKDAYENNDEEEEEEEEDIETYTDKRMPSNDSNNVTTELNSQYEDNNYMPFTPTMGPSCLLENKDCVSVTAKDDKLYNIRKPVPGPTWQPLRANVVQNNLSTGKYSPAVCK